MPRGRWRAQVPYNPRAPYMTRFTVPDNAACLFRRPVADSERRSSQNKCPFHRFFPETYMLQRVHRENLEQAALDPLHLGTRAAFLRQRRFHRQRYLLSPARYVSEKSQKTLPTAALSLHAICCYRKEMISAQRAGALVAMSTVFRGLFATDMEILPCSRLLRASSRLRETARRKTALIFSINCFRRDPPSGFLRCV